MKKKLLILLLAFVSFSCLEEEETPSKIENGTYVGQFYRSSPTIRPVPANVVLVLEGNSFSGTSDRMYYPAIGRGTYYVSGEQITFKDASFWTANFDWTIILDNTFSIATEGDGELVLTRKQGDVTDVYRLKRQVEVQ
ncbi:hypothetical protein [Rufibacter roseus]|uniref:Lipocalin-like domain-containing protein n=1 Tax=Rufibacter roseus TaxID=1567108 RepID=A0ABW2DL06_9BACT|nr:hypothetical protein [Rufibacter roseus]